jgi:pimeloyl-ACP methyl ester carboxylesterase
VPAAPTSVRELTVSDIPTLILSGSFDTITSLAWAYAAAGTLPNSRIASIPGAGHFVTIGSPCAQAAIASFLQRPDEPDTNCVATLRPPTFATP